MMIRRSLAALFTAAIAILFTLAQVRPASADEDDDEAPISSHAAQLSHDAAGHVLITIAAAAQKEIGIRAATLAPVRRPLTVQAYGYVLDPGPLSRLNSDLAVAQAALDASAAQYRRTSRLYREQKNVSLRDLQTAQAAYLTDQSQFEALRQQLRDQWGNQVARMRPPARARLVGALVDRREALARVTAPAGQLLDATPGQATLLVLGHEDQPLAAQAVYDAPSVVPSMQGQTYLVLLAATGFPIRPGTAVSATLPVSSGIARGVIVPRAAVVRYAGSEWVYQEVDGDRFMRREITPAQITPAGYFVTSNVIPGMRLVVTGAQTLLSEELKAQIQIQD
jgi:hypothetical protein